MPPHRTRFSSVTTRRTLGHQSKSASPDNADSAKDHKGKSTDEKDRSSRDANQRVVVQALRQQDHPDGDQDGGDRQ